MTTISKIKSIFFQENKKSKEFPMMIGSWKFVRPLSDKKYPFLVGLYKKSKKPAALKILIGDKDDIHASSLRREILVLKILSEAQNRVPKKKVFFPKFIEGKSTSKYTYLASEFINGESMTSQKENVQYSMYKETRNFLYQISKVLTNKEKNLIGIRVRSYFATTGVALFLLAMVKDFKYLFLYMRAFVKFIGYSLRGIHDRQILTHGDLNPYNIIVKGDKIYLIDFEQSMITYESFEDATTVSTQKIHYTIRKKLVKKMRNKKSFSFLLMHVNAYNMIGVLAKKDGNHYRKMIRKAIKL